MPFVFFTYVILVLYEYPSAFNTEVSYFINVSGFSFYCLESTFSETLEKSSG